jgi:hypothetical protein
VRAAWTAALEAWAWTRARTVPGVRGVAGEYYDEVLVGDRRSEVAAVSGVPALIAVLRLSTVDGELVQLARPERLPAVLGLPAARSARIGR